MLAFFSPEFMFFFMAASMLNVVATTTNPFYTAAEITKELTASKAKLVVTLFGVAPLGRGRRG